MDIRFGTKFRLQSFGGGFGKFVFAPSDKVIQLVKEQSQQSMPLLITPRSDVFLKAGIREQAILHNPDRNAGYELLLTSNDFGDHYGTLRAFEKTDSEALRSYIESLYHDKDVRLITF